VPEPVLELTNATVVRDDRRILDNLSLTIRAGEHTAIVGPNGAGKSFLTRLLSHDERPLVPENGGPSPIRVFGSDNWDVFNLRSQLGIVSAEMHSKFVTGNNEGRVRGDAAVLSGFIASQGILRYGAITPEMRTRAAEALAKMGASHLASRWLDAMSSGEARRVLLARALVTNPRALVLDEPTTSLDLAARHDFMERVRQIARDGTTLILVTHHIEEIIPEVERVVLLKHGKIVANGPKRDVLTAERLTDVFESPIALIEEGGYYYARPASRKIPLT
jgi:iron complex transport system ATP-binding protein